MKQRAEEDQYGNRMIIIDWETQDQDKPMPEQIEVRQFAPNGKKCPSQIYVKQ